MIESIEFGQGVLRLTVSLPRSPASCERERSVQFDFGESGTVSEFHSSELVNFLYSFYPKGANQVCDLIFELLGTHAGVRRVHFHCIYGASEVLEYGASADEKVQLPGRAIQSAGSEEDIPF